jgi:hypothetical protein
MTAPGTGSEVPDGPDSISTGDFAGWRERLLAALQLRALVSPRVQQALLVAAAVFLLVGLALSINAHPQVLAQTYWPYLLVVIAVNLPLGLALVVAEFMVSARLIRASISVRYALFTVICGSAANMLPLPGAFMARMAGLKSVGARYRDGAYATLLTNLVWLSLSFLWSGAWLASVEAGPITLLMLTMGVLLGGLCLLAAKWLNARALDILVLFATRLALIANQSARLLLCLLFGIREGTAAALGPIIGLTAAAGFLAAFLNRILDLAVLAPLAAILAWRSKKTERLAGAQDSVLPAR